MKNKTRIWLVGAQSTGKTTILNHYKEQGMNAITEVVRNLSKTGVKINEVGDKESQKIIFDTYKKLLNSKKGYISDRGLVDVTAYSMYLTLKGNIESQACANNQLRQIETFFRNNPDVVVCYFPIEFDIVDDGVRSLNNEFRQDIDIIINNILEALKINYVTVTGTVEERIKIIDEAIKDN